MMNKKAYKKIAVLFLVFVLFVTFFSVSAYASTGDFTIKRRVVNGYKVNSYTFNKKVTKTISLNAKYTYDSVPKYYTYEKHNELYVSIYKWETHWYGDGWEEYDYFKCVYSKSTDGFTLSKSVTLPAGKYGFRVWRALDDKYLDKNLNSVGYFPIKGNVCFK